MARTTGMCRSYALMSKPESTSAFPVPGRGGAGGNGNRHDGLGLAEHIEIDIPKGRGRAAAAPCLYVPGAPGAYCPLSPVVRWAAKIPHENRGDAVDQSPSKHAATVGMMTHCTHTKPACARTCVYVYIHIYISRFWVENPAWKHREKNVLFFS